MIGKKAGYGTDALDGDNRLIKVFSSQAPHLLSEWSRVTLVALRNGLTTCIEYTRRHETTWRDSVDFAEKWRTYVINIK